MLHLTSVLCAPPQVVESVERLVDASGCGPGTCGLVQLLQQALDLRRSELRWCSWALPLLAGHLQHRAYRPAPSQVWPGCTGDRTGMVALVGLSELVCFESCVG